MNLSYQWLKDYLNIDVSPLFLAELLTEHAQEVADVRALFGASHLSLGQVLKVESIDGSKNQKCLVDVGSKKRTIVCGASNVAAGQTVIVALPGAVLPGGKKIEVASLGNVTSEGMICSLSEIGISPKFVQEDGIHVVQGPLQNEALDDTVIELDLTPNRMDLLSVLGCAYEVGALTNTPVNIPPVTVHESNSVNPFKIDIQTEECYRYYGRFIENIKVQESPEWLKLRLMAAGIRPINNVVDVTNYVMLDLGQPLHAFDADLISTTIEVRLAHPKEKFTTLDQQERTLQTSDIVITDKKRPVALGGVMGGLDSEVSERTVNVFLESAVFAPKAVSKTSRRLDLRSESSMRFERGVASDRTVMALDKAAQMIADLGAGTVAKGMASAEKVTDKPRQIELPLEKINSVLGLALTASVVAAIFKRLDLNHTFKADTFIVEVPPRRIDLEIAQDLIEEVGRIYGYQKLESTLPSTVSEGALSPAQARRRRLKSHLESLGFNEVVTYSLSQEDKDLPFLKSSSPVSILRPIHEDNQTLKQSLIPSLLQVVAYHQARQIDDVKVYEWSKSYQQDQESEMVGLAWMGRTHQAAWQLPQTVDFYQLKGVVESVLSLFSITADFEILIRPGYHPHQSASIVINAQEVGTLGQVHPLVLRDYDLKDVFAAELNISLIQSLDALKPLYKPVTKAPFVKRDVAFVVPLEMPSDTLIKAAYQAAIDALDTIEIIDIYHGAPLKNTEKSMTLRVTLSSEVTFKSEAIDERINQLIETLQKDLKITLRT